MEKEIEELKARNAKLESQHLFTQCNSEAVVAHLSKSIRELKNEMAKSINDSSG